mmetsp:Transcript_17477/g.38302  ORF Transcript_17477/g.38302 Transcript_17477/m.38302 type:complete len:549 (-) Transcript_17477:148-1794(-)
MAVVSFLALGLADYAVIALYLVGMLAVVMYANKTSAMDDSESFFLGGRTIPWWVIGCSLFASNVGTDHLLGLTGSGAASGLAVGNYEWSATYILLLLGWVFAPRYFAYNVCTVPDYVEKTYSKGLRDFLLVLSLAAVFFTKITVTMFAGAVVLKQVVGLGLYAASALLLGLTALYTAVGGLAAVMFTEVLQVIVLLMGSFALLYFGMREVGGWTGLHEKLPDSHFHVIKPMSDPDFPWLGVLLGMPINSIWYWCTDQVMVQRVLGTDKVADAQRGCVLAGWLKLLPMFTMVLPGLIAAALYPEEIEKDPNTAFPLLVTRILPPGWVGVMLAAMLSSFMGALASCFNSCSTLFTMNVYKLIQSDASEEQLVKAGRIFTVLIALISLAWLPVIDQSDSQLFLYIQGMQVIWCAPIASIFLAPIISDKVSSNNAWITLSSGLFLGVAFWVGHDILPIVSDSNGITLSIMVWAIILFVICMSTLLVVHLAERYMVTTNPGIETASEASGILEDEKKAAVRRSYESQEWAGGATQGLAAALMVAVVGLTVHFW